MYLARHLFSQGVTAILPTLNLSFRLIECCLTLFLEGTLLSSVTLYLRGPKGGAVQQLRQLAGSDCAHPALEGSTHPAHTAAH